MLEAQHLADALQGLCANPEQGFFTASGKSLHYYFDLTPAGLVARTRLDSF